MNPTAVLEHHASRFPDRPAIVSVAGTVTYGDLYRRACEAAAALAELGVGAGQVVGVLMHNRDTFFDLMHGAAYLGAIFMPLNWRLAGAELAYILNHSEASALVSESALASAIDPLLAQLTCEHFVTVDEPMPGDPWLSWADLLARSTPLTTPVEVEGQDVQRLMYTSGTTSRPKGVMITNDNVYWKNISHVIELGIREDVRALAAGPLYHVGALDLTTTTVLYVGGTNFLLDRFTPHGALAAISAHAITCVWLAPAMVSQIVNSPELADHELESVRLIIDGGEKMPLPLIDSVLRTFPNAWFVDAYGMTETVSGDTFLDKGRTRTKLGSVGRPVIHTEVAILDELDNAVPAGHPGEVVLRGPKVCKGYWRDPKATAEAIRNGWLRTGDMGYLDEDGYLFLVDRKKDMILSGGENISSAEVERALYEHPAVLEAAVVGVRDPRWGEVPVAYVVRRASAEVDSVALIAFCAKRLAKFKVPRWIRFLDVLPRNPSGKVLKRVLREQDQDAQDLTPCSADEG